MNKTPNWKRQFLSDTLAGVCPEVWQALERANQVGYASSYGDDEEFTKKAAEGLRRLFGRSEVDCRVFFVGSGTIANALALTALCRPFDAVLCHSDSHLEQDEANAPEYLTGGAKLIHVPGKNGKIDPSSLQSFHERGHGCHSARIRVLSLTQATEWGTAYSLAEWRQLLDAKAQLEKSLRDKFANSSYRVFVHVDGARFANALALLEVSPIDLIAGVDVLSFGGSKNGGPPSEAIIFFDAELAEEFAWRMKQSGQLVSKMRYLSAPWLGMLEDEVWLRNAKNANTQARRLAAGLQELAIQPTFPVDANMVFAELPERVANGLQGNGWAMYSFQSEAGMVWRFVCSWSTTEEAVDGLIDDFRRLR